MIAKNRWSSQKELNNNSINKITKTNFRNNQSFLTDFGFDNFRLMRSRQKKLVLLKLMKSIFLFMSVFGAMNAFAHYASASVIINQVLYDPISTETGGEAVELYNTLEESVNISNWFLQTESSYRDVVLPANTLIQGKNYFLIADTGWSTNKDNTSWPDADYEETMTLKNTDSGIILRDSGENIIDIIGWGNANESFFEGTPAAMVLEGKSLLRNNFIDTSNNTFDFSSSEPVFKQANNVAANSSDNSSISEVILVNLTVYTVAPVINKITIDDEDLSKEGLQVIPETGAEKQVTITAEVESENAVDVSINFKNQTTKMMEISQVNSTTKVYSASILMQYYELPGNYSFEITANNSDGAARSTAQFEYAELEEFSVSSKEITVMKKPGEVHTTIVTVRNTGNIEINLKVKGNDLVGEQGIVPVTALNYDAEQNSGSMSTSNKELVNILPGQDSEKNITFQLSVPKDTVVGNYLGSITIVD